MLRAVLLVCGLICGAAHAADITRAEPFSLDRSALAAIDPGKGQAGLAIVRSEVGYRFDSDCRYDRTIYLLGVIRNEAGLQELGQIRLAYRPWLENAPTLRARVLTAGQLRDFDPDDVVESTVQQDGLVYSTTKYLHVPFENLEVGSVVEMQIAHSQRKPSFPEGVAVVQALQPDSPSATFRMTVDVPVQRNYRVSLLGGTSEDEERLERTASGSREPSYGRKATRDRTR